MSLKKCIFHQKIGNQLKRTWHQMKADPEETMCEIWRTQVEYLARKSNLQKG